MPLPTQIADGLTVYRDVIQVGCLGLGEKVALIGIGEGQFLTELLAPDDVQCVLFTHHHRDEASGLAQLSLHSTDIWVPLKERHLFDKVEGFWSDAARQYHQYEFHPTNLSLRRSVPVARALGDGDSLALGKWHIEVLDTPGHTLGSVSYLVSQEAIRVAFVGDLIYAAGQVWDFHSLQGRLQFTDGGESREYHGFGERAPQVLESLERVLEWNPDCLIPSHGEIIREPRAAVDALRYKLDAVLANYRSTSAGRWYFPHAKEEWRIAQKESKKNQRELPSWVLEPYGTSRTLQADDGSIFLIDCAGNAPHVIQREQEAGRITSVDAIWITHYHDDHVERINQVRAEQGCPVIVHERMADILRNPAAYLMPCLHHQPIQVDRAVWHGEAWSWKGFHLTAYDFPGQSYYDAALLAERDGVSVLFTGDSMTPGGLDDYCCLNRNLMGDTFGYLRCLALLDEIEPDLLVNEHVSGAFTFTREQRQEMRKSLQERLALLSGLMPWDHPNYGLDHRWIACYPYSQEAQPGKTIRCEIHVTNYSDVTKLLSVQPRLPVGWYAVETTAPCEVSPGAEGNLPLEIHVPQGAQVGRHILGFSVEYGDQPLGEFMEAIVDVIL